jgi:erythromycin 3''-O-methyltransferase
MESMPSWTRENIRHGLRMLRYDRNPAAAVYDSIGEDFFLALAPGWLNLGLWEGDGSDPQEAPVAVRRLVDRLASDLPKGGDVLDVGNGLGVQDPVIAAIAAPSSLTALNVTWSQLRAGREQLAAAGARGVNGDATRMPLRNATFDGLISVEAAFHFPSRRRFFDEAFRVLRPGGLLTMSDIPTLRRPRGAREVLAAVAQLRVWGLRTSAAATPEQIADQARSAGFVDVHVELIGDRVLGPAFRFVRERIDRTRGQVDATYSLAARLMAAQAELLWTRGLIDYLLLRAARPGASG